MFYHFSKVEQLGPGRMDECCQAKARELEKLAERQGKTLRIVLAVNATMFLVELIAGISANSLSLIGDSLDMLGDAIVYVSSLYVLRAGMKSKAKSALLKGGIMLLSAVAVFGRAIYQTSLQTTPILSTMSGVGLLALGANLVCLFLLTRHRQDDINMSSVWLCSRNDIIANTAVLAAAGLILVTGQWWPDLVVGLGLTFLFAKSSWSVLRNAWSQLKLA
ncbi:cation transporter [Leptolyngbya sp. FACHB-261]|uniref:cation transporter n=1 Tax=Leptolyngbya sp. FACHB-261 TaxID=2692806 RepID=UPI001F54F2A1|nr:cation transporter [Leptolyngbya sp. FACHB-261]